MRQCLWVPTRGRAQSEDAKFRRINLANEAIRTRVLAFGGAAAVLRCAGFERDDEANAMVRAGGARRHRRFARAVASERR